MDILQLMKAKRRVVVWAEKDGGVSVTSFSATSPSEEQVERAKAKCPPGGTVLPFEYNDELPDSPFESWKWDGERIVVNQALAAEPAWEQVRAQRDRLLAASDWAVLPDAPTTEEERKTWMEYRQALRDITNQPDPHAIVWPEPPGR